MCNSSRAAVAGPRRPNDDYPPFDPFADGTEPIATQEPLKRPRATLATGARDFPGEGRQDKPPRTTARTKAREVAAKSGGDVAIDERFREWKDANGGVIVAGRFLSLINKTLWVKTHEGKKVRVSLDDVSDADREYIENRKWD